MNQRCCHKTLGVLIKAIKTPTTNDSGLMFHTSQAYGQRNKSLEVKVTLKKTTDHKVDNQKVDG